ncbi:MAG TPA: response regulator [Ferruginibacter sp.]|nr:response regulator [Ferruginibacter sp.]
MKTELNFLVIENAPDVCEGIIRRMAVHTHWKSLGYCTGVKDALEKIYEHRPSLLFLDWGLIGGSAFEIMQKTQNMDDYHPYIIFNTGFQKDNPEIPQEIINNYRVDKYLVKPIWEILKQNLSSYLEEAEEKTYLVHNAPKKTWLQDIDGRNISVELNKLICICQNPQEPRQRIFYFQNGHKEIMAVMQWHKCYELLNRFTIDYFITSARSHLVCKNFIDVYEKPFVRMLGFPAKMEVVKEKAKQFEEWLQKS